MQAGKEFWEIMVASPDGSKFPDNNPPMQKRHGLLHRTDGFIFLSSTTTTMKISLFLLSLFAALIALVVSAPTPGNAPSTPTVDKEQKWMKFNDPSIHKAVRDGDIRKVKEYIADNEKNLNLANAYGNTVIAT